MTTLPPLERLKRVAQAFALDTPGFFDLKGAGLGDRATNSFMKELRRRLHGEVPEAKPEQRICGENKLAVDFYILSEKTIVEFAFSLRNPNSEFERDVLKALMAQDTGYDIRRLVFVSKPGALKRHGQPSSRAIVRWARQKHGLEILFLELRKNAT